MVEPLFSFIIEVVWYTPETLMIKAGIQNEFRE